jgi:hypothetical protein
MKLDKLVCIFLHTFVIFHLWQIYNFITAPPPSLAHTKGRSSLLATFNVIINNFWFF